MMWSQNTKQQNKHTVRRTLPPNSHSHVFSTVWDDDLLLRLAFFCSLSLWRKTQQQGEKKVQDTVITRQNAAWLLHVFIKLGPTVMLRKEICLLLHS